MGYGERLREERIRLGLSQPELAAACGVSRNSQINYEAEKNSPAISYFQHAADRGMDIAYVISGVRALPQNFLKEERAVFMELSAREEGVLSRFRRLDETGKRAVDQMLSALQPDR